MTKLRILDFDIENRPLAYLGPDYSTADITALAWCWVDNPAAIAAALLGRDHMPAALLDFAQAYKAADVVTGHYIREHDLPIINGALIEHGLPPLEQKLTVDTKIDLTSMKYLSKSQENLCEMLGVPAVKVHMSNAKWREANRLTERGLALTYKRVVGDIKQHMLLRKKLVKLGLLGSPEVWRP